MYSYIKGIVTQIESDHIVIENGKIGYLIYTPNPYSFEENTEYKIYLYQYVKEDEISLYGFKKKEEKDLFLRLISVKGLGCKMAIPIIAASSPAGIIDAIERENILYLKKFPKIGDKVARQIILDLKGKLVSKETPNKNQDELIEALKALGYKNNDIVKVIKQIKPKDTLEEEIKEALKLLLK